MSGDSQPRVIHELLDAVYPSFALLAGMQLDVFSALASGPLDVEQVAEVLSVSAERLGPLLYALVAAGLLSMEHGRFANARESEQFLVRGRPGYIGQSCDFLADIWRATLSTADSIRSGMPQARHDFATMSADQLMMFLAGLHGDALGAGQMLAASCDLTRFRHLVDVGGGSGGLALAVIRACPRLRATVVDLANVVQVTERFVTGTDVSGRIDVRAADVSRERLPGAYDLAVLKSFVQTLSPEQAQRALVNISSALEPGAWIYILGAGIVDDSRTSPAGAAFFNIVFVNYYEGGRAYTESEYRDMLTRAGFEAFERKTLGNGAPLLCARKPA